MREKNAPFRLNAPIKVLFTETDRWFVRIDTPDAGPLPSSSAFQRFFRPAKPPGLGEKVTSRPSDPRQVD